MSYLLALKQLIGPVGLSAIGIIAVWLLVQWLVRRQLFRGLDDLD